jgi:hypothetical protein
MSSCGSQAKCALWTAFSLAIFLAGCGSRYDESKCPGTPFPDPRQLLSAGSLARLTYFRAASRLNVPSYEMWADRKFDFETSLSYYYDREKSDAHDCVKAVALSIRYPITPEKSQTGLDFLGFFESRLKLRLDSVRSAYLDYSRRDSPGEEEVFEFGNLVFQVNGIHHTSRGDFLRLALYEKAYFDQQIVLH